MYPKEGISDDEKTYIPCCVLTRNEIPNIPEMRPIVRLRPRCKTCYSLAYTITNALRTKENLDNFLAEHPTFELNSFGRLGYTVLGVAMSVSSAPTLVPYILKLEPHLARETCYYDMPYVVLAAAKGSLEFVQLCIKHGADPCAPTANGRTALGESAADAKNIELTKYLLLEGGIVYDIYRQRILREAHIWGDRTPERVRDQKKNIADAIASIRDDYEHGALQRQTMWLQQLAKNSFESTYLRRLPDDIVPLLHEFLCETQHKRARFLNRVSIAINEAK